MFPDETTVTPTSPNANSPNNNGGTVNNSPHRRNLWASVVRGGGDFPSEQQQPEQEDSTQADDDARRVAWNNNNGGVANNGGANNGVVVEINVSTPMVVGGSVSWPALSESTRPGFRSWTDTNRNLSEGSLASSPQAPIISSQPPHRPVNTNSHHHTHSAANSTVPNRPRQQRNRGAGGGANANAHSGSGQSQNNNFNRPTTPMPPRFPVFEPAAYGIVPQMQEAPVRGPRPVTGIGGVHPHSGNEHSSPRNNNPRRGNFGPRPRGDGHYHNNHGGRRDQDRRDVHVPPQYAPPPPMGYMPPPMPHGAGPFMPHVRMYPGQMGFDMSPIFYLPSFPPPPESFGAMSPIVPQPSPMIVSPVNENLMSRIIKQIDYWFSEENLIKDNYLKSHMDEYGWVSVSLLANFPRVQQLTKDVNEILEALRFSTIVEIQGDKVRRRDDWNRFLLPSGSDNGESGTRILGAATETVLASSMQQVSLNDSTVSANGIAEASQGHTDMATAKVLPKEISDQSRLTNGEDTSEESH